jgi:hypothetical protein
METETDSYDEETLARVREFASRLSECDRRAFAALEAYRRGVGGVTLISRVLEMSPETIKRGREDLDRPERLPESGRQRHTGAGRKGVLEEQEGLEAAFDSLVETHLGGDPMNEGVVWTDLQPPAIARELSASGYQISENTVRKILKKKDPQAQPRQGDSHRRGRPGAAQPAIREHRATALALRTAKVARAQRGHQKEGVPGRPLPGRETLHP